MRAGEGAERRLEEAVRRCREAWEPRWAEERERRGAPEPEHDYVVSFTATEEEAKRILQYVKERRTYNRSVRCYPPERRR